MRTVLLAGGAALVVYFIMSKEAGAKPPPPGNGDIIPLKLTDEATGKTYRLSLYNRVLYGVPV